MNKNKITRPKHVLDNRSNQLNPQHPEYYRSRGVDPPLAERLAVRRENQGHSLTHPSANPGKTHKPSK